ncbi:little elongation complex subunit 1 [Silurus meridionalis]|nr:little elongation complex subunit 1 [Silurus meridionalis]
MEASKIVIVDRIHALLTGTSELPVLRDEEKHVISEFCVNESLAETFLSVILEKIKVERGFMGHDLLQSLCRVYVGVCQQRGDSHKAHALVYRLLKEEFLEAPKVIMVMVTAWPSFLSHESSLCQAIHIVSNLKAKGKIFYLLTKYLHWDEEGSLADPEHLAEASKNRANTVPRRLCSSSVQATWATWSTRT